MPSDLFPQHCIDYFICPRIKVLEDPEVQTFGWNNFLPFTRLQGRVKCWGANSQGQAWQLRRACEITRGVNLLILWISSNSAHLYNLVVYGGQHLIAKGCFAFELFLTSQAFSSRPVPAIGIEPWELGANLATRMERYEVRVEPRDTRKVIRIFGPFLYPI